MSVYTPLPNPWKGIPLVGALIDAIQNFLAGLSGSGASVTVSQTAHGFVVGDVLRYDATSHLYVKAQADSAANAEALGIVSVVTDANTFTLLQLGKITGLSGLVEGSVYFLNPSVAGALTTTNPTTPGQVSKPLLVAISTTAGYFFNYRGEVIAAPTAPLMGLDGLDANQSYIPPLSYGTSLPANPVTGQEAILVDSTSTPSYSWRFRYNGNSSNTDKWECVGGGGFLEGTTSITIPRAGVWYVEIGAEGSTYGASSNIQLSITAGGITLQAFAGATGGGTEGVASSAYDKGRMSGLTASQVLTVTGTATRQFIRAQPVRVS